VPCSAPPPPPPPPPTRCLPLADKGDFILSIPCVVWAQVADLLEAHVPCCSFCNRVNMYCCAGTACNAMRARCEVRLGFPRWPTRERRSTDEASLFGWGRRGVGAAARGL